MTFKGRERERLRLRERAAMGPETQLVCYLIFFYT